MNEFGLIARLCARLPRNPAVVVGAGDDCAVLDLGLPDRWVLFKTDAVVEGVHFVRGTAPERVGHKALARCLSDVAAMAGEPSAVLVTIALPRPFDARYVERVYAGLGKLARRHAVAVVGGETSANPERLLISVALLGTVAKDRCVLRSGAQPGDTLWVTGELGGSRAGKHLDFEPRLAEGRWLAGHFSVHAMIDLSDGLAGDLRHVLRASGVGAELCAAALPISAAARRACRVPRLGGAHRKPQAAGRDWSRGDSPRVEPAVAAALTDGEDFELLFAVPRSDAVRLPKAWRKQFPSLRLTCIGHITADSGLLLRDSAGVHPLALDGYVHFA